MNDTRYSDRIFLCHANEDKKEVRKIYSDLKKEGYFPWIDEQDLLPGQDFESEIRRVLDKSACVIIFFSSHSIRKRGFIQRELKAVLRIVDEIPSGEIFVIPIRIDKCEVPREFSHLHWVNFYEPDAFQKVLDSLLLVFSGFEVEKFSDIAENLLEEEERLNLQNLRSLITEVENKFEINLDGNLSARQIQLFNIWSGKAMFATKNEELMRATWGKLLAQIVKDPEFDEQLLVALEALSESDLKAILELGKMKKMRAADARMKQKMERFEEIGIVDTKITPSLTIIPAGLVALGTTLYGVYSFFLSMAIAETPEELAFAAARMLGILFLGLGLSGIIIFFGMRKAATHEFTFFGDEFYEIVKNPKL